MSLLPPQLSKIASFFSIATFLRNFVFLGIVSSTAQIQQNVKDIINFVNPTLKNIKKKVV
jgi:hypothetical protein